MNSEFFKQISNFLEKEPLYKWAKIELPENEEDYDFGIDAEMYCEYCKKDRPFKYRPHNKGFGGSPRFQGQPIKALSKIRKIAIICNGCSSFYYEFYIFFDNQNNKIQKVGQFPPWSIAVNNELKDFLDSDIILYKKAKICISQGYGIASFAYYRRLLENVIKKILIQIKNISEIDGDTVITNQIEQALSSKVSEKMISLISEISPKYLVIEGNNPFTIIHNCLSEGIHNNSDDDCLTFSLRIDQSLSFIIKTIYNIYKEKEDFKEAIKNLAKK